MSGTGRFTGCDLGSLMPLCMPWEENLGLAQPVFSREAALLSFELAASAYDLNLDAWREAGWRDFSFQVDNTLLTGMLKVRLDRSPEASPTLFHRKEVRLLRDAQIKVKKEEMEALKDVEDK